MEPLVLQRNCGNCRFFDEDCHCSLRRREVLITGGIIDPNRVVCEKHEEQEREA